MGSHSFLRAGVSVAHWCKCSALERYDLAFCLPIATQFRLTLETLWDSKRLQRNAHHCDTNQLVLFLILHYCVFCAEKNMKQNYPSSHYRYQQCHQW